ncbi:hypothetical protein C8245_22930 [Paracidovorax avenae]|uniref:hypothetical protein n=1 Tax=Paracidovorax avenae TaxID=80867 RepID=UPI000D219351|nr:hypothetical protein [Paracidovorax avenae]AVS68135.1 hypothetical protein C8245_22930 [Paracidovorax avenae]
MAPLITAIVLSASPVCIELPGLEVLGRVQTLRNPADLHAARLDALSAVLTPWCFFLDDDDELPADYLDVLQACVAKADAMEVPMAYTDEILREPGSADVRRCWYQYDRERHRCGPMGLHHLVLMRTANAKDAAARLPRGTYWTEHMLFWAMGGAGAAYVPRVGYIWNRRANGWSRDPRMLTAQVMTRRWIEIEHREGRA